jgi:magnesium chelatase subunit H
LKRWVSLRKKPPSRRKVAVMLYGFPPGVGATGTAALLNVPKARSIHWSPYDRVRVVNADP